MTVVDHHGLPDLVLASASPRRAELLRGLGVHFTAMPTEVDETRHAGERALDYVERVAKEKAAAHAAHDRVVIGADTIVVVDHDILGKPVDADDARRMLQRLSGRTHEVLTCVAVAIRERSIASFTECTEVTFTDLSDDDIAWYLATGEPFDKAGAYGIQGAGGLFVTGIEGSYHNVVGLPLAALVDLLSYDGLRLLDWA